MCSVHFAERPYNGVKSSGNARTSMMHALQVLASGLLVVGWRPCSARIPMAEDEQPGQTLNA